MADEDALAVLYRLRPEIAVIASGLHANAFSLQDVAIDDELPGLQAGGGRGYGAYGSTAGGGAPEELAGVPELQLPVVVSPLAASEPL